MRCFWCRKQTEGKIVCADCKPRAGGYSMAKKLEMADRIKGVDKLEKTL